MALPTIKVMSDPQKVGFGVRVFVNGFEIQGVENASVNLHVGDFPSVTLTLRCWLETADYEPKEPIHVSPEP